MKDQEDNLKEEVRISFSKNKIKNYVVGNTGIVSANGKLDAKEPIDESDLNFSGLLRKNLDKLADKIDNLSLDRNDEEIKTIYVEKTNVPEKINISQQLSDEEILENLDYYNNISLDKNYIPVDKKITKNKVDLYCRNCGQQFMALDNFCAFCGNKRA